MKSPYHESFDKGFPVIPQEVENLRRWSQTNYSGPVVIDKLKQWNLNGCGLILWKVNHLDHPSSEWTKHPDIYILPDDEDKLIQDLANISLSNAILWLDKEDHSFWVYVGAIENGDTNIDADVLEEFAKAVRRQE